MANLLNGKSRVVTHPAKDDTCHHCKEVGHCKRNYPAYLAELIKKKKQVGSASSSGIFTIELFSFPNNNSWVYDTGCGTNICITKQGFRIERKLKQRALYLYVGNGVRAQVEAIGSFDLVLPNGLVICLDNCHYAPTITRGVVSVSHLVDNGFVQYFTNFGISVSKNGVLYFNDVPRNGIYEIDMHDLVPNVNSIYNVSNKRVKHKLGSNLSMALSFLLIISKKRIKQDTRWAVKLTPPYTPQHNGVSERRNRTLLDMVRSMMNLTTLPLSFWDYALESATRILNMVPTKKVDKTPYELWYGKVPNLSYLKVWGCEALVKRDTPDKLEQRSVKYAEFFEKRLISQEISGRAVDLEEIQEEEDTTPSEITSNIPQEVEGFEPPQEEVIPIQSNKWIDAMNAEIQSMMDNMVWVLVDLPPGCKTVGSRWLFKKKTDMDGIVHVYKARLVAKAAYMHYEIWQMVVKKPLNGYLEKTSIWCNLKVLLILIIPGKYASFKDPFMVLSKHQEAEIKDLMRKSKVFLPMKDLGEAAFILGIKIYRDRSKRLIGLCQNAYMDKILKRYKMDNSKRGHIPMQERLDLNKSQGAQTPKEVNRMKNVPYASAVGSIMYAVRCTRPDVAFAQNMTSRFQQNPGEPHWTAVKNILKYLRNTKDMFLVYGGNPSTELRVECYCDAGFETDRDDTKSQTGYVFVLNGGAVDWKSSKQSTTAMSATESEYIAASEAAMEAVWIRKFISGLGIVPTINEPLNMYCDNSAAVHYANEPGVQKGARHYQRRYHYVRECVELGEIRILKVHTDNNLADPFTKALSNRKLTQHARGMGLRPASSFM
ncbi:retrotransposon protein, putative, ty1-copia subclass [Tanacetum coccineum]